MENNLYDHFREVDEGIGALPLNKMERNRVTKIKLVAIMEGSVECEDSDVVKHVCFHSGMQTEIPGDSTCQIPYDINDKIHDVIRKVRDCVSSIEYGEMWIDDDDPINLSITIETVHNTYSQLVCERCLLLLNDWIRDVYHDVYGEFYELYLGDFEEIS